MENKSHALAAGAFVVLVAALLVALAAWLSRDSGRHRIFEIASREGVTGLQEQAPVRYKGLAVLPSGFGTSLAEAISRGEDIQAYGEMILNQFFNAWVNARFEEIPDGAGIVSLFEKTRGFLTQKTAGYGIERVLYTLNRDTACLSPVLKDFFVLSPDGLLMALETDRKSVV